MIVRVLLIHGDDTMRQRHADFLRSVGFHVIAVPDGHGAIDLARSSRVDVLVTDANPRGAIDGIELTRRLRNDDGTRRLRVIVLTEADDSDGAAMARAAGCTTVLDRQGEPAVLASEIRRLLAPHAGEGSAHRRGRAHRAS